MSSHPQRKHRRVPFAFNVVVEWGDHSLTGFCQRMATAGLYIYTPEPFPAGAEVGLGFQLPVVQVPAIQTQGKVRLSDPEEVAKGNLGGMQVLFSGLSAEQQTSLETFVSSCIQREAEYVQMSQSAIVAGTHPLYEVRFFGTGNSRSEYVVDISEGGVMIRTLRPRRKGTLVDLDLYLPGGQRTTVVGEVAWARQHSPSEPGRAGMGIRFVDIKPEAQEVIGGFVDTFGEDVQVPIS